MKRRAFLASLAAAAALPRASWADAGSPAYLAAAKEVSGDYSLSGISRAGAAPFARQAADAAMLATLSDGVGFGPMTRRRPNCRRNRRGDGTRCADSRLGALPPARPP